MLTTSATLFSIMTEPEPELVGTNLSGSESNKYILSLF
jgi:hypothetical protein